MLNVVKLVFVKGERQREKKNAHFSQSNRNLTQRFYKNELRESGFAGVLLFL